MSSAPTTIALNKAHFPVTVLGPGRRIGLWVQGCSIGCAGCISQDTWSTNGANDIEIAALVRWCREVSQDAPDGITISGGEPFDQPHALAALLDALIDWRARLARPFDLLCYSGYPLKRLEREHAAILARLDAIIPEPFVESLPLGNVWRGSSNQPLVALSALGRERFGAFTATPAGDASRRLQVSVEPQRIWYIGIPGRDDMQRVEAACLAQGLVFTQRSWR